MNQHNSQPCELRNDLLKHIIRSLILVIFTMGLLILFLSVSACISSPTFLKTFESDTSKKIVNNGQESTNKEHKTKEQEPVTGKSTFEEQEPPIEDSMVKASGLPIKPETEYYFKLFWSQKRETFEEVMDLVSERRFFILAIQQYIKENPHKLIEYSLCVGEKDIRPEILEMLTSLRPGNNSEIFAYDNGFAIVYLTTDKFFRKGKELLKQREYSDAVDQFQYDLEINPSNLESWRLLGLCYFNLGSLDQALEAFNRGLEWDPNSPALLGSKASVLIKQGKIGKAVDYNLRAYQNAPSNPFLANNLAWSLLKMGRNLEYAESLAKQAIKRRPMDANILDTLGRIQAARGKNAQAVVTLHRALLMGSPHSGRELLINQLLLVDNKQVARLLVHPTCKREVPLTRKLDHLNEVPINNVPSPEPTTSPSTISKKLRSLSYIQKSYSLPRHKYYLQTGSFKKEINAHRHLKVCQKLGWIGEVRKYINKKGELWYRTLIGPYGSSKDALKDARNMLSKGIIQEYKLVNLSLSAR